MFIWGIYLGRKSKEKALPEWWKVGAFFFITVIFQEIRRIDAMAIVGNWFYYYACSLLGFFIMIIFCILISLSNRYKFMLLIESFMSSLASITLEAYLLHSAFKNVADYPSHFLRYCLIAVFLPIMFAYILYFGSMALRVKLSANHNNQV